ncbi:MAG: hypothetical protein ACHQWU_15900 [Gemmatimonadales bacterium]|jgi:hypothetical protein
MTPFDRILAKQFLEIFAVVGTTAMVCGSAVLVVWLRSRSRREAASPELSRRFEEIVARLERLDASVEAVAVEVERISEGQRFTTKILADRPTGAPVLERPRPIGSTTPH